MERVMLKHKLLLRSAIVMTIGSLLSSCSRPITEPVPAKAERQGHVDNFVEVNTDNPGKEAKIKNSIVYGKYTVMDFSSEHCPSCVELKPMLQRLLETRHDIVVRCFDVDRKGAEHIDWQSPLIKQYNIGSLPHLKIFNEKGNLVAEGKSAKEQIIQAINNELNH